VSAEVKLSKNKWFRLAFFSPLVVAAIFAMSIIYYADIAIEVPNKENIDVAVSFFKIPLLIAALIFPLCAMAVANHRSEQNINSMRLQKVQNNFANYWLHFDRFDDVVNSDANFKNYFFAVRKSHDRFFPGAINGDISLDEQLMNDYRMQASEICNRLNKIKNMEINVEEKVKEIDDYSLSPRLLSDKCSQLLVNDDEYVKLLHNTISLIKSTLELLPIHAHIIDYETNSFKSFHNCYGVFYIVNSLMLSVINFAGGSEFNFNIPMFEVLASRRGSSEVDMYLSDKVILLLDTNDSNRIF